MLAAVTLVRKPCLNVYGRKEILPIFPFFWKLLLIENSENAMKRKKTDKILGIIQTVFIKYKHKLISSWKHDQTNLRKSEIGHVH